MRLTIKTVSNGYVVSHSDNEGVFVFQAQECDVFDETNIGTCVSLLRHIADAIGPSTSRYSAKRIRIDTIPGDKYEEL